MLGHHSIMLLTLCIVSILVLVMPIFIAPFSSNVLAEKINSSIGNSCHSDGNDSGDKLSVIDYGNDDTNNGISSRTNSSNNNNSADKITNDLKPSPVVSEPKTPQEGIFPGPDQLTQQGHK